MVLKKTLFPVCYLLLLDFSLRIVVDGLFGIRQVLSSILNVRPFEHHAGTARQDQFLVTSNR